MQNLSRHLLGLFLGLGLSLAHNAYAGQNILYYYSDAGDYIGGGQEVTFNAGDGNFTASSYSYGSGTNASFSFSSADYSNWWSLNLMTPDGSPLKVGAYPQSQRWPFQAAGYAGMDFSGDGRGCNTSTGSFRVLDIQHDASGNLTSLAVNFIQHCEGAAPALRGQVRFNSDIPLSAKPLQIVLENTLNSGSCVEASSSAGAEVNVQALNTTDSKGGNNVNLSWSSNSGATGSGASFNFTAPLISLQNQPNAVVTLTLQDLTNNTSKTISKNICVSDTTPPAIVINLPQPGATIVGNNLILDVSIRDAVDLIDTYQVQVGNTFNSPINPKTSRAQQQLIVAPNVQGKVELGQVIISAKDFSGNKASKSVNVKIQK